LTYADAATGTAGSFTAANRKNARWIGALTLNSTTSQKGMLQNSVASVYGGLCPERFAFIYTNDSGAALASSGFALKVRPIKYDVA
jgi:hypothetical protein